MFKRAGINSLKSSSWAASAHLMGEFWEIKVVPWLYLRGQKDQKCDRAVRREFESRKNRFCLRLPTSFPGRRPRQCFWSCQDTTAPQRIFQRADFAPLILAAQIELQKIGGDAFLKKARLWETLSRLIHNESCLCLGCKHGLGFSFNNIFAWLPRPPETQTNH